MKPFPIQPFLILSISVLLFIHLGLSIASAQSDSGNKDSQVRQIETDLSREKEQYQKYEFEEKNLLEQLSAIEEDITGKRVVLKEIREEIDNRKNDLNARRERLEHLEKSLSEMEELLEERVTAFYKYAKRGYIKILATADDLVQLNRSIKYLRVVLDEDRKVMELVADEMEKYKREVSVIEEQIAAIADLENDESSRLASLDKDLEKKVIFLTKIHQEKEFHETAVKELQSAAEDLKGTLTSLEKIQKETKALPSDFAESKGRLPLPFSGEILSSDEKSGERDFNTHKGIYIRAPFGSDVKAIFPGRVDFSGQLKGYGQVIVINHGSRFFSISAYLLQRNKSEGEMVSVGDIIGQVGEAGLVSGPALYFEIREGETNHNPLAWLKVD
jgi:septal ring factor EnvC (AmiA/AmiB activator)